MHPAIKLLEQSFAIEGGGTLQIWALRVRSGYGPGTTVGPAKALRPTGHLQAHQGYGLITGQEHSVQATPGR
jgi:hypothetical protein